MTVTDVAGTPGLVAETPDLFHARVAARQLAEVDGVESVAVHVGGPDEPNVVRATGPIHVLLDAVVDLPHVVIHETRSRYLLRHRIRWRPGDPSPGVSVLYRVQRNPDLDAARFHEHWEHTHGPLAVARHLGMWDYEQLSIVDSQDRELDGIAVVQFPCLADFKDRFFDGPEGRELIIADAGAFTHGETTRRQLTTEQVMKAAPLPAESPVRVSDHRQLELSADPGDVWAMLGDFGAILDWWPGGLVDAVLVEGQPAARVLTRADGGTISEALLRHDDVERMFQTGVTDGFPPGISDYTCRYEVRAVPNGCRVDWDPRATVEGDSLLTLAGIVDDDWRKISVGLARHFRVTPPSMGGVAVSDPSSPPASG